MSALYRSIFLALTIIGQTHVCSQGTWERISVPTSQSLNSLFFTDSLYGWIVGDSGTIIHTADGGITWVAQESPTDNDIINVFFLDRNRGWASSTNFSTVPYGTVLLKTINGGADWTGSSYPVDDIFITCILYLDSLNGWMGGKPHALVKTTDGGITWTQAAIDTSVLAFFPVLGIRFYDSNYGYACGGMFDIAGVIWRTSNGGDLWYAIDPSEAPADEVHELYCFDSLHVIGAGGDPDFGYGVGMIRTSDGGQSWNYQELGIQGNAFDLDFRDQKEVWAPLGPGRKLIYSLDTGHSWSAISTPDSSVIVRMTFPDSLHGFAVGRDGVVLKYRPQVAGINDPPVFSVAGGFTLFQNYPNPFSSATRIRFTVPQTLDGHPVSVKIKVFSVFGTELATLVNGAFRPGEFEIPFEAAGWPSGIYFYRLSAAFSGGPEANTSPRKMILLK